MIDEHVDFLCEHCETLAGWPEGRLQAWVQFSLAKRRMVALRDETGKIVAVGAARCLTDRSKQTDWYHHRETGDLVFVDFVVSAVPGGVRGLWMALKHRFRDRDRVAFRRLRDDRTREYNLKQFERRLNRHGN